jgi:hypothetical protein
MCDLAPGDRLQHLRPGVTRLCGTVEVDAQGVVVSTACSRAVPERRRLMNPHVSLDVRPFHGSFDSQIAIHAPEHSGHGWTIDGHTMTLTCGCGVVLADERYALVWRSQTDALPKNFAIV